MDTSEVYEEGYSHGYDAGYAARLERLVVSSEHHVAAVARVRSALGEILAKVPNYSRMTGHEIHQHDGQCELAREILAIIADALEGRP